MYYWILRPGSTSQPGCAHSGCDEDLLIHHMVDTPLHLEVHRSLIHVSKYEVKFAPLFSGPRMVPHRKCYHGDFYGMSDIGSLYIGHIEL